VGIAEWESEMASGYGEFEMPPCRVPRAARAGQRLGLRGSGDQQLELELERCALPATRVDL